MKPLFYTSAAAAGVALALASPATTAQAQPQVTPNSAAFTSFDVPGINRVLEPIGVQAQQISASLLQFEFNNVIYQLEPRNCTQNGVCRGALVYALYPIPEGMTDSVVAQRLAAFNRQDAFLKAYADGQRRIVAIRYANAAGNVSLGNVRQEFQLFGSSFTQLVRTYILQVEG